MTYHAGHCKGITVHVVGRTPQALDENALDLALGFFGRPSDKHHFVTDGYVAEPAEILRADDGTFMSITSWEADVTVRLVEKRSGY